MDEKTYRALIAVLAYLLPDEKKDWEENGKPENGKTAKRKGKS